MVIIFVQVLLLCRMSKINKHGHVKEESRFGMRRAAQRDRAVHQFRLNLVTLSLRWHSCRDANAQGIPTSQDSPTQKRSWWRHRKSPSFCLFSVLVEYKLNVLLTYLRLRAFSRSESIKCAFNFRSSVVSKATQSESGPSSSSSPVSMFAAPSTFPTTASMMTACLLPSSSWYLWWIRLTYLPQWLPLTTIRRPLSRVGLGLFDDTHAGGKPFEVL